MNGAYLAAIERAFLAHAGRGLMLSAADITLVDQWDRAGMPLEVVLAGLATAFERPGLVATRVRGLAFARRSVEEAMELHRSRAVGGSGHGETIVATALALVDRPAERLRAHLAAAVAAAGPEASALLTGLQRRTARLASDAAYEDVVAEWLPLLTWAESEGWTCLSAEVRAEVERELEARLGAERRRADPEHFAQTWDAHRRRLVRAHLGLPDVSALDARA